MLHQRTSRFQSQHIPYENTNNSVITFILIGIIAYFLLYLFYRDESSSNIPSFFIVVLIIFCVLIIISAQINKLRAYFYRSGFPSIQRQPQMTNRYHVVPPVNNYSRNIPQTNSNKEFKDYNLKPLGSVLKSYIENESLFNYPTQENNPLDYSLNKIDDDLSLSEIQLNQTKPIQLRGPANISLYHDQFRESETYAFNGVAMEQYEEMGIRQKIPIWVENARYWMSYTLIPMILRRHQQNLDQLQKFLGFYNRILTFHRIMDEPMIENRMILWENLYNSVTTYGNCCLQTDSNFRYLIANDEQSRNTLIELVNERANLERYFRLRKFSVIHREYVIDRLNQLKANFAGEYNNPGRIVAESESWNQNLPKDSEVS